MTKALRLTNHQWDCIPPTRKRQHSGQRQILSRDISAAADVWIPVEIVEGSVHAPAAQTNR